MSFFGNQSNWQLRSLKEIATLKRGYDLPTKLRTAGKVPIYAANGQNGSHNEAKIKGPGVITGRSGTIGKVHYTSTDYWPLNTSLYVTNFHGNDPKWVFYMLKAFQLERFVEGAGVPTLNRNLVHDELIPLPPLDEQKRIAAILDKADTIRRKRQQAIQLADDFLRSVFLDMFGDPVTWNKNDIAKGWTVKPIEEISLLKRGYDLPKQSRLEGNIPIYAANGITGTHNEFKVKGPGVITGRSGTIGKVIYSENDFWPLNTALYVTNFYGNNPKYIEWYLRFLNLERYVQGAGVPTLNRNLFLKEVSAVPPKAEQDRFEVICKLVSQLIFKNLDFNKKELFNSLSQKAFAGEL
ncbi:restriction endonuclease subunit S [Pseudoalteromonas sp. KG3]|uniref:Restriction endonuclease subunit S n=1 Tax=Pseudoalteromonas prydzensis TaxID=182141 RepID=A0ABR9FHF3_9GAMM|nr:MULTISPECIES: restriction endonuclease subunit S [Pseudoalteromonas]MBE0456239.1 restriction endonuclease subunit S [Pseudoalteromonas prydzensis]WKD24188.1 restriction endonuclease subunit S [Pseudoalteromonas sp. KG3]